MTLNTKELSVCRMYTHTRQVSEAELVAALKQQGFLEQFFGQNVTFEQGADQVYEAKVKTSLCLVM